MRVSFHAIRQRHGCEIIHWGHPKVVAPADPSQVTPRLWLRYPAKRGDRNCLSEHEPASGLFTFVLPRANHHHHHQMGRGGILSNALQDVTMHQVKSPDAADALLRHASALCTSILCPPDAASQTRPCHCPGKPEAVSGLSPKNRSQSAFECGGLKTHSPGAFRAWLM